MTAARERHFEAWQDTAGDVLPWVRREAAACLREVDDLHDFQAVARRHVRQRCGMGNVRGRMPAQLQAVVDEVAEHCARRRYERRLAAPPAPPPPVSVRVREWLRSMFVAEIVRQDLPIGVRCCDTYAPLKILDRDGAAMLLGVDPNAIPSEEGLRYLCGRDDRGAPWIGNVDPRLPSVAASWAWVIPPAVWQAVRERRRVLVFGQVMLVEHARGSEDFSRLPLGYAWEPARRMITSNGQRRKVEFAARAYATRVGPWESTRVPAPRWLERR